MTTGGMAWAVVIVMQFLEKKKYGQQISKFLKHLVSHMRLPFSLFLRGAQSSLGRFHRRKRMLSFKKTVYSFTSY